MTGNGRSLVMCLVGLVIALALIAGCAGGATPTSAPATVAAVQPTKAAAGTAGPAQPTAAPAANTIVAMKAGPKMAAPVKIGFLSSLTGALSDSSTANKRGFEQAVKDFNSAGGFGGEPVQSVIYDDEFKPDKAVEMTTRLVSMDKVVGIVGWNASGSALAALQIPQDNKVILIGTGGGVLETTARYANQPDNYCFGVRMLDRVQAEVAIKFMMEKRGIAKDKFAIVHDPTAYGVQGKNDFAATLAEMGTQPCAVEQIQTGDKDATSQLQRISQAGCQAVIVYMYPAETTVVLQSGQKIGFKAKFFGNWGWSQPALYKLAGQELVAGVPFVQSFTADMSPESKALVDRLQKTYNEVLFPLNSAQGYDGALVLLRAISAAGSIEGPKVLKAMESLTDFKGTTRAGASPFSKTRHDALDQASMYFMGEWKNGVVVTAQ